MMKKFLIILLSFSSLLFAKTKYYDFDEYVGRFNENIL